MTWWMCFNPYPEGDKPQVRHACHLEAQAEAARLCVKTGRKIHVLKCVGTYHPPQIPQPVWEARDTRVLWFDRPDDPTARALSKSQISNPNEL